MLVSSVSDSQLVWLSLRRLPWVTLTFAFLQISTFALIELNQADVFFGFDISQGTLTRQLAFDLKAPLRHQGMTILTSFFAHEGAFHFFSNLPWLLLFAFLFERKRELKRLSFLLISGHLLSLVGASIAMIYFSAPQWVLGMSGGVLALGAAWVCEWDKIWGKASVAFWSALFIYLSPALALTHILPMAIGLLVSLKSHPQKTQKLST